MANRMRGDVEVELDGIKYTMRPTWQIIERVERELGGILALMNKLNNGELRIDEIAFVIFCGLEGNKADKTPSLSDIHECVFDSGFVSFVKPVSSFLVAAVGGMKNLEPVKGAKSEKPGEPPLEERTPKNLA